MPIIAASALADTSLARVVPADVGLYIELRDADDLLVPLAEPQLWLTLADLAGQPAALGETAHWRRRVEQTIGLSPTDAIRALFSKQVAYVGEGLLRSRDAVVICRPGDPPRSLIDKWDAKPLPTAGRIAVYRLPNRVAAAVSSDTLIFGNVGSGGMFDQVVSHLEHGARGPLADDSVYQSLLSRTAANPDGLLFARLNKGLTAIAGDAGLPALMHDASAVLFALYRDPRGNLLHVSVVSDAQRAGAAGDEALMRISGTLPKQTLVSWTGNINLDALATMGDLLPQRSLLRLGLDIQQRVGNLPELSSVLAPQASLAVGVVVPANRRIPAPPIPAGAALLTTRDPQSAMREFNRLVDSSLAIFKLLALQLPGAPELPLVLDVEVAGHPVRKLDLTPLLGPDPARSPLGELHVCWAIDGDVLIITTHSDWMRQILESRAGATPRLSSVLRLTHPRSVQHPEAIFVAQPGPISDLGSFWLRFLERTMPAATREDWWRNYQPGGRGVRLGLQVVRHAEQPRLIVRSVRPDSPAAGLLEPGDEILGCNHRRFATSQPVREALQELERRPNARWIDVLIERNRIVQVVRVPIPFVDPVEVLRRIVAIGQVVHRVVYFEEVEPDGGPRGRLTVQLRAGTRRLFDFPSIPIARPPSTRPATPPATQPTTAPTQPAHTE